MIRSGFGLRGRIRRAVVKQQGLPGQAGTTEASGPYVVDREREQLRLNCPQRGDRVFQVADLRSWSLGDQAGERGILMTLAGEEQPWFVPFYLNGKASYSQLVAMDRCMADLLACSHIRPGGM